MIKYLEPVLIMAILKFSFIFTPLGLRYDFVFYIHVYVKRDRTHDKTYLKRARWLLPFLDDI